MYASKTIEEIGAAKHNDTPNGPQVVFQQVSIASGLITFHVLIVIDLLQCQLVCDLGYHQAC